MAGKPKYVSLEPKAFLSDDDFQIMTAEERGVYFSIILYLYGNNGRLKFEDKKLRKLCNVKSDFDFQTVLHKFQVRRGYIRHKRVTKELKRAQGLVDRAVKAQKARMLKQCLSNAQANAKQCQVSNVSNISKVSNKRESTLCINPTLQECIDVGITIGIPPKESEVFFHHYNKKGWVNGNKTPLTDLRSAMVSWRNKNYQFKQTESIDEKLNRL